MTFLEGLGPVTTRPYRHQRERFHLHQIGPLNFAFEIFHPSSQVRRMNLENEPVGVLIDERPSKNGS